MFFFKSQGCIELIKSDSKGFFSWLQKNFYFKEILKLNFYSRNPENKLYHMYCQEIQKVLYMQSLVELEFPTATLNPQRKDSWVAINPLFNYSPH